MAKTRFIQLFPIKRTFVRKGKHMLNKKELEQTLDFLTMITESARALLDEVATFEVLLQNNKNLQKAESKQRSDRKKRQRAKQKARN